MTQKEKFAQWCRDNTGLLKNSHAIAEIQSQIPGLEVKKVNSGALLIRFSPKDEWMDVASWYQNYVSNCSLRLKEEVQRLKNVCSPEQYASVLALFSLLDNSGNLYVNGYDRCDVFLNTFKEFVGDGVFTKEESATRWGQFLHNLEQGTLGWSHDIDVFKGYLLKKY